MAAAREIRQYLEETLEREGSEGWTRRDPRTTHPEILNIVRAFMTECDVYGRTPYDDDTEQAVEREAGNLPEHYRHGHDDRHPLTYQLGAEVYIARSIVRDEERARQLADLHAAGFVPLEGFDVVDGERYTVRAGTLFVGQSVPQYSGPVSLRGKMSPRGRVGFVRKGARNFVHVQTPALIRAGWDA